MAINPKATAKVQGYIPKDLKARMERVAKKSPYYSISVQTYMALEARMAVMEDRVGLKGGR
jgi:hypothetical protein